MKMFSLIITGLKHITGFEVDSHKKSGSLVDLKSLTSIQDTANTKKAVISQRKSVGDNAET